MDPDRIELCKDGTIEYAQSSGPWTIATADCAVPAGVSRLLILFCIYFKKREGYRGPCDSDGYRLPRADSTTCPLDSSVWGYSNGLVHRETSKTVLISEGRSIICYRPGLLSVNITRVATDLRE